MPFEDRIRQAVAHALDDVRSRLEQEVRLLVRDVARDAAAGHQFTLAEARDTLVTEAQHTADRRVAEAEARLTATIDRVVADACAREREQAVSDARRRFDADADRAAQDLLDATRALDAAGTAQGVVDALVAALRRKVERVAVIVIRNEACHGWALSGFGADASPARLDGPLHQAPLIERVVHTGQTAVSDSHLTFGAGSPAVPATGAGIAVPLLTGGRVVAVAYADALAGDGRDAAVPRGWQAMVELVCRHAAQCLQTVITRPGAIGAPAHRPNAATHDGELGVPA